MEYLREFIVLKEGGKVLYCNSSELIKDEILFGGFLEAINSFYNISLKDDLRQIEGIVLRISFLTKLGCQFVGISSMNVSCNDAIEELQFFTNRFIELFPEILNKDNENDVRIFQRFNSEIIKTKKDYLGKGFESNYLSYLLESEDW